MRKKDELSKPNTCMQNAHPEEMVFVLLSRDAAAPVAIRAWVAERIRLGKNTDTDPQITEALECARTMELEARQWVAKGSHCSPDGLPPGWRLGHRGDPDRTNHPTMVAIGPRCYVGPSYFIASLREEAWAVHRREEAERTDQTIHVRVRNE